MVNNARYGARASVSVNDPRRVLFRCGGSGIASDRWRRVSRTGTTKRVFRQRWMGIRATVSVLVVYMALSPSVVVSELAESAGNAPASGLRQISFSRRVPPACIGLDSLAPSRGFAPRPLALTGRWTTVIPRWNQNWSPRQDSHLRPPS